MPLYYYQIKGKNDAGHWTWPPLFADRIEAESTKQARKMLEEEYGMKLPGGRLKKEFDSQQMLLTIMDITDKPYMQARFNPKECTVCGITFTPQEKYMVNAGGSSEFCSSDCHNSFAKRNALDNDYSHNSPDFDYNGIHDAVIYKITNRVTGKCYIGKTTQAFTLRWYQHFYQGKGTKFYEAIRQYMLVDWTFEIIETIDIPKGLYGEERKRLILERESYWIKHYNSIVDGYNSAISLHVSEKLPELFTDALNEIEDGAT